MAAPNTPEEWLDLLTRRLDERRPRIERLRSYVNGNAQLPEGAKNVKAAWQSFQRKARTNFGELIVEALAERLICQGFVVDGGQEDDPRLRQIWTDNRLDVVLSDAIRDMLVTGVGYGVVGRDAFGQPVMTSEPPEFMYASTDPLRPWKTRAAVKVWRDIDMEKDFAYLWAAGVRVKYSRSIYVTPEDVRRPKLRTGAQGGWQVVRDESGAPMSEQYEGDPPVVVFENHDGTGEFEPHIDLIDRVNKGILDRLVMVSMQAFRQRAFKGGLPQPGEGEQPIDYASMFAPAPGALWDLPDGIDVWESQDASQGILAALQTIKDDIRDLAAVTRTPSAVLMPDSANQSAEGAAFAREGLVFKAKDRIARIKPSVNEWLRLALSVVEADFDGRVDTLWAPPESVSLSEKYAAAVQAQAAGVPWRTVMLDILGFSQDRVDAMAAERASDQLTLESLMVAPDGDA